MAAKSAALLTLAGMLALSTPALAACRGENGWLRNYDGAIADKYRIRLTLDIRGESVTGVYFYVNQLRDIKLKGYVRDGTKVVLEELDSTGTATALFDGEFLEADPRGRFSGKLQCEVIAGEWHKVNSQEKMSFYLSMESATGGTLENRYAVAGATDDELIHRNARRFWEAVKRNDKQVVASLVNYPVLVSRFQGGRKTIRSAKELVDNYDAVFSQAYRDAIANAVPRNMFARDEGIMLGNGEVWFGPNGKVITLNN